MGIILNTRLSEEREKVAELKEETAAAAKEIANMHGLWIAYQTSLKKRRTALSEMTKEVESLGNEVKDRGVALEAAQGELDAWNDGEQYWDTKEDPDGGTASQETTTTADNDH